MANLMVRGIPADLHRALKRSAELNRRSLNGEIVMRLERSVRPASLSPEAVLERSAARAASSKVPPLTPELLKELKESGRA